MSLSAKASSLLALALALTPSPSSAQGLLDDRDDDFSTSERAAITASLEEVAATTGLRLCLVTLESPSTSDGSELGPSLRRRWELDDPAQSKTALLVIEGVASTRLELGSWFDERVSDGLEAYIAKLIDHNGLDDSREPLPDAVIRATLTRAGVALKRAGSGELDPPYLCWWLLQAKPGFIHGPDLGWIAVLALRYVFWLACMLPSLLLLLLGAKLLEGVGLSPGARPWAELALILGIALAQLFALPKLGLPEPLHFDAAMHLFAGAFLFALTAPMHLTLLLPTLLSREAHAPASTRVILLAYLLFPIAAFALGALRGGRGRSVLRPKVQLAPSPPPSKRDEEDEDAEGERGVTPAP